MDWREDFSTHRPIFLFLHISSQLEEEKKMRLVCSGGILGSGEPTMLHIRGEFSVNTQVNGPKMMRRAVIGFTLLFLTVFLVPTTQAADVTGTQWKEMSQNESHVMKAEETPSFGTEDWVGPEEQGPVVAVQPPSLGTEDWTGPTEQGPIVVVKSPSLGTEEWTGTMESSEALGAGTIPEPGPEELNLDDYNPD
ncbi:MAG: hypothetical protein ACWGPR_07600 [Candidatus Deferrimicrobiaceae bacterium]